MARGFESKDVEYQQAERERTLSRDIAPMRKSHGADSPRASLELSLARMRADLERASVGAHRRMIEQAMATLEAELASLNR